MEIFVLTVSLLPAAGVLINRGTELVKLGGIVLALMVCFCDCLILL